MLCSRSWVNRIYKSSIKGFLVIHIERLPAGLHKSSKSAELTITIFRDYQIFNLWQATLATHKLSQKRC